VFLTDILRITDEWNSTMKKMHKRVYVCLSVWLDDRSAWIKVKKPAFFYESGKLPPTYSAFQIDFMERVITRVKDPQTAELLITKTIENHAP
jgi:hypothetical protein